MLLPLAITSCGDDTDDPSTNTTKDPDGTIIVNVSHSSRSEVANFEIELTESYNLQVYKYMTPDNFISIVGPVKSIANITTTEASVRNLTWSYSAAAQVGYGYLLRLYHSRINDVFYYDYYACYVDSEIASTSGGVLGYKLKVRKLLENVPWSY